MTKDDIIKMAIEAKLPHYWPSGDEIVYIEKITHFAQLVAKHTMANIDPSGFMSWQEGYEAGATAEREACAKVVLDIANDDAGNPYKQALRIGAEAIRARGEA